VTHRRRRRTAVWAGLSAALAALLAIAVTLAAGVVPKSWEWAHNQVLLWGATGALLITGALVGVLQARSSASEDASSLQNVSSVTELNSTSSNNVIGSVTGTVVQGETVIVSSVGATALKQESDRPLHVNHTVNEAHEALPRRNPVFTGRKEVLNDLEVCLAAGPVAVVAVRGLGGVGKSQVALEYAHRMYEQGCYELVGWVRADSRVTVAEDLAAMAPLLELPTDKPVGDTVASVLEALRSRQGWLVVFDNAQSPRDLANMLPGGNGHVLITSRNRAWNGIAAQLDLEVFDRAESVMLLRNRTGRKEPAAAGELADELGDLPLALAQAAAYIDTRAATISGYLTLYRDPEIARRLRAHGLESAEYPVSVARTWLLHFDQLSQERPAAIELLRLCAFLDPDEIDLDLLSSGVDHIGGVLAVSLGDRLERTETVGALARASLVNIPGEGRLRVHRLVQAVTRDQLDSDQAQAWARRALALLEAAFPAEPWEPECWPECASLVAHVQAAVANAEVYPALAEERGALLGILGIYLVASAQYVAGRAAMERTVGIQRAAFRAKESTDVNNAENVERGSLEIVRTTQLNSLDIQSHLVKKLTRNFHYDDPDYARSIVNVGIVQRLIGDPNVARETMEEALSIESSTWLGRNHPEYVRTLVNLGLVERDLSDFESAQSTLKLALVGQLDAYGRDHPEFAGILTQLGIVQRLMGHLRDARETLERALAIEQKAYGSNHPEFARTLGNLGVVQRLLGDVEAARNSLAQAESIFETIYGPDHPITQQTRLFSQLADTNAKS
jgi:tetratricopeptide (TPR) repeat protein